MSAMQRDVHAAARVVQAMARLLHAPENLMASCELGALVPQLEIRPTQGRLADAHEHFALAYPRKRDPLDRDPFVPVKHGGCHGSVDSAPSPVHPFTAPSVRPATSHRWTTAASSSGGSAISVAAAISAPHWVEPSPTKLKAAAISVFVSPFDRTSANRK